MVMFVFVFLWEKEIMICDLYLNLFMIYIGEMIVAAHWLIETKNISP